MTPGAAQAPSFVFVLSPPGCDSHIFSDVGLRVARPHTADGNLRPWKLKGPRSLLGEEPWAARPPKSARLPVQLKLGPLPLPPTLSPSLPPLRIRSQQDGSSPQFLRWETSGWAAQNAAPVFAWPISGEHVNQLGMPAFFNLGPQVRDGGDLRNVVFNHSSKGGDRAPRQPEDDPSSSRRGAYSFVIFMCSSPTVWLTLKPLVWIHHAQENEYEFWRRGTDGAALSVLLRPAQQDPE